MPRMSSLSAAVAAGWLMMFCVFGALSAPACVDPDSAPGGAGECDAEFADDTANLHVSLLQRKMNLPQGSHDGNAHDAELAVLDDDEDKEEILATLNEKLATELVANVNEQLPMSIIEKGLDPMKGDVGPIDAKGKLESLTGLSTLQIESFEVTDLVVSDTGVTISIEVKMALKSPLSGSMDMNGMPAAFQFQDVALDMAVDGNLNILEDDMQIDTLDVGTTTFNWDSPKLSCQGSGIKANICNKFGPKILEKKKPAMTEKLASKVKENMQAKFSEMLPIEVKKK